MRLRNINEAEQRWVAVFLLRSGCEPRMVETVQQVGGSRSSQHLQRVLGRMRLQVVRYRYPALRHLPSSTSVGACGEWCLRDGAKVSFGTAVCLQKYFYVYAQAPVSFGRNVFANRNFYLSAFAGVSVGDNVRFGERCSVHDENHLFEPLPLSRLAQNSYRAKPIKVGDNAWIGSNCVLLAGAEVGAGTVVAANSVVTGTLPPGVLAGGCPAKVIRPLLVEDTGQMGSSQI